MSVVPEISDISKLLLDKFNLKVESVSRLTGYDDLNYAVVGRYMSSGISEKYVLKIVNVNDSNTENLTEAIMNVLTLLPNNMETSTPRPIATDNGKLVEHTSITGVARKVVLLSYIDGIDHKELRLNEDNFLNLCHNIGCCAGRLASQLHILLNDTRTLLPLRPNDVYMTENLHLSRDKLNIVTNLNVQNICSKIMDVIESLSAEPSFLTKTLIHHDLCLENLVFSPNVEKEYAVVGVIDFSDMTFGYSIFDAAIPIASCMYQTYFVNGLTYFAAAKLFMSGFQQHVTFKPEEIDFLYYAVLARFASLRILGGYDVLHNPQTSEHEVHESSTLDYFIEELWSVGKERFDNVFHRS